MKVSPKHFVLCLSSTSYVISNICTIGLGLGHRAGTVASSLYAEEDTHGGALAGQHEGDLPLSTAYAGDNTPKPSKHQLSVP